MNVTSNNMAQQITPPTKKKKPGKKRRAAIKAAHLTAAKSLDDQHVEKQSLEEGTEERPAKRTKVSHTPNVEAPKPSQLAGASIQKEGLGKPGKVSRNEETLKEPRNPEDNSGTKKSSKKGKENTANLDISETHNVIRTNIISSSEINRKVTHILSHLSKFSFADVNAKPIMVEICADRSAISKAVSIVEITKSELGKQGAKWYQYSMVEPKIIEIPRKDESGDGDGDGDGDGGRAVAEQEQMVGIATSAIRTGLRATTTTDAHDDPMDQDKAVEVEDGEEEDVDGSAFEAMAIDILRVRGENNTAVEQKRPKLRAVPRLVIYLSRVRSEKWRVLYGEQTNSEK